VFVALTRHYWGALGQFLQENRLAASAYAVVAVGDHLPDAENAAALHARRLVSAYSILGPGELPVPSIEVFINGKPCGQSAKNKANQTGQAAKLISDNSHGEPSCQNA
jgi:hypothetical protein